MGDGEAPARTPSYRRLGKGVTMLAWLRRLADRIKRASRDRAARDAERMPACKGGVTRAAEPDQIEELKRLVGEREARRASRPNSPRRPMRRT
jgi:hypothetical protein